MTFLANLLAGGDCYEVKLSEETASLTTKNEADALDAFQRIADEVLRHAGEGYDVALTHQTSDRPGDLIDAMVLSLHS